ncbi:hypothetical protein [Marilutibacter spongiae]|uniref:Uncharacterized protein n=1 Tax=Marilutibacter spongiae TaxID=2025720 RepID=A0A7W3Y5J7_9GAMM|nr:hypothetical protein [Lysobacter spongiae]MBB1059956.1 hypothetical protein [Lysobacter spongiae]
MPIRTFAVLALLAGLSWSSVADAFTVNINSGSRALYLRVGNGVFTGNYSNGGTPGSGGGINTVSVTVPSASLGNSTPLAMTGNASQITSNWDGYAFCNTGQIYIGGFYRYYYSFYSATLTVTAPADLASPAGDRIPFSEISWTSSGNGDSGAQPIPSGSFTGGEQVLASFPANTWRESCMSFRYANSSVAAAGVYSGRVTYTLAAP